MKNTVIYFLTILLLMGCATTQPMTEFPSKNGALLNSHSLPSDWEYFSPKKFAFEFPMPINGGHVYYDPVGPNLSYNGIGKNTYEEFIKKNTEEFFYFYIVHIDPNLVVSDRVCRFAKIERAEEEILFIENRGDFTITKIMAKCGNLPFYILKSDTELVLITLHKDMRQKGLEMAETSILNTRHANSIN